MPLNTDKLQARGITHTTVEITLDADIPEIAAILNRNGLDKEHARVVRLNATCLTYGQTALNAGSISAVLHTDPAMIPAMIEMAETQKLIYIYSVFTEPGFEGMGIASMLLETLPGHVEARMGFCADALILAVAPQAKNNDGRYVSMPMGIEYLVQYKKPLSFYTARGFVLCPDMLHMVKRLK
jgi:GNAT superfamily N-acetyltransferase